MSESLYVRLNTHLYAPQYARFYGRLNTRLYTNLNVTLCAPLRGRIERVENRT